MLTSGAGKQNKPVIAAYRSFAKQKKGVKPFFELNSYNLASPTRDVDYKGSNDSRLGVWI
jgi:hypothetical protein